MRPRPVESIRSTRDWLIPAALLALAPKCLLCLLAYVGLGATLGFGGPEFCGATGNAPEHGMTTELLAIGITCGLVGIFSYWRRPA